MLLVLVMGAACAKRPPPRLPVPDARTEVPRPGTADATMPAPELDVRIEPSVIRRGESALLTWEGRNARSVVIDHNIGAVDLSGRIRFFPEETTTYQITAEGAGGRVDRAVTVEVRSDWDSPHIASSPVGDDLSFDTLQERFGHYVKPVFFGFDSAELTEEARLILDLNAGWLRRPENSELRILIEGHCDERGSEEYNLALGEKRAQVVREFLVSRGVGSDRIQTVSMGEERPFDTRQTEDAYALNRRAQFVLLD